ncbi:hypothetical protein BT69DRAFT_632170 [Atractiella rhizophila]|nr:hypothetical protein BT69DRAFT_632170 [Atractiella rhizophila]
MIFTVGNSWRRILKRAQFRLGSFHNQPPNPLEWALYPPGSFPAPLHGNGLPAPQILNCGPREVIARATIFHYVFLIRFIYALYHTNMSGVDHYALILW